MNRVGSTIGCIGLALLLAGCFDAPGDGSAPTAQTPTPPPAAPEVAATPAPTDVVVETQPAGSGQVVLTVWMPDSLYALNDAPGRQAFLDQLATFDEQRPDISVLVLAKRLRGPGGMLAYLRTAAPVAPSILPDLALVDRDAMTETARDELVVPIQSVTEPAVISDLYPAAIEMAQLDGELVGLPYLLEVDHTAYRQTIVPRAPASYEQVIETGQLFAFPGGVTSGVSPVVLLQYMAAGGVLVDDKGAPTLDAAALAGVLTFYAQARDRKDVTPELFQLPDTASVWDMYRDHKANFAAVTSTQYLSGLSQVNSTRAGSIPTGDGKSYALVRGWSWVVVTRDPARQEAALALLAFLMSTANQGRYSEAANWLPSQPAALALWSGQDTGYPAFAGQLLISARAMPESSVRSGVGAAIQDALEAVVLNGAAPSQAAGRAADAVATGQVFQP